ncbi:MAG TPA: M13 family metallopeptidase [Gemmatimonadaceae bacterium]|nr:M13 family metallopeptidase [Gemmatimonadaceae bacterium]
MTRLTRRALPLVLPLALLLAALHPAPAVAQSAQRSHARSIDPANMDTTCAACEDFYEYANGGWLTRATIPAAYSVWGSFNELADKNNEVVHSILEDARAKASTAKAGSNEQKLGIFYGSCMDSAQAERQGITPIKPMLDRIAALHTRADVEGLVAELHRDGLGVMFSFGARQDPKNSTDVIAIAGQGGLGLPDRDYYTRTDEKSAQLRDAYVAHVARTLELSGVPAADARAQAQRVMALETQLANASMTRVQQRDPNAVYHKMSLAEVQALTPSFQWNRFLQEIGVSGVDVIDVRQPDFFKALDGMLDSVPVEDWQAYLRWHVLDNAAPALSSAFVNEDFNFNRNFTGATELLPRWRRCLQATNAALGEALGQEYVRRTFTPAAKKRALEMVNNLQAALRDHIEGAAWMSDTTKQRAIAKLQAFTKKIGYPDKWRDYSTLEVKPGAFVENLLRARSWETARNLEKIGRPVDRTEWGMTPPTVNAYYNPSMNEIVFPAGILQPPFFDPNADDAVNYGGMGAVIGHEMTHGFDDQGRQFDAQGNLRDWWTAADAEQYKSRAERVSDQFDGYTVVDSTTHVNGKLTLGENIADLGGLTIAYAALEKALAGKPRTKIDGFTPEQRFFLSWAQVWRQRARPEYLRSMVATNPHSPGVWRVNGPLSNMPEFAKAFGCKAGDPMVRPPEQQAQIW